MTEEEQLEAIKSTFCACAISQIYGNYIMDKEETEEGGQ